MSDIIQNGQVTQVNLTSEVTADFSMKTLYQEKLKTLGAEEVIRFANSFTKPLEFKTGKYIEGKVQYLPRGTQFASNNFVPGQENTGAGNPIRRNVDKLWLPTKIILPEAIDENIYQSRLDYRVDQYVQKLLNKEEFVNDSFATLSEGLAYVVANRAILGKDYIDNIDGDSTTHILHCDGLKDLVAMCNADTAEGIYDSTFSLTDGASHKNIVYKSITSATTAESRTEALAQFNTLVKYMKQPNSVFSYGSSKGTPIMQSAKELTILATIDTIEAVKAIDMDYFKKLSELFDITTVEAIPKTSVDCEFGDGSSAICGLIDIEKALNIQSGDLFIIEKDAIEQYSQLTVGKLENMFQNNITISHFIQALIATGITPDKAFAKFSAPILVSQYALPVVDLKK